MSLLRLEKLTKRFGPRTAVDALDLEVRPGDIFGFLGLNGAGKTTTIRMILRLIRPTSGSVLLYGIDLAHDPLAALARVGALVEVPAFYPYLSGRDNLGVLARTGGGLPAARLDDVLARVGLADRAQDKVRGYSQGMRQRLGIAQALLARPEFVILDEPTNGLDPQGIADIRALIRELHDRDGVTVLVSSHQLSEVEQLCNRVAILKEGRLAVSGSIDELLAETTAAVRLRVSPPDRALELLRGLAWCAGIERERDGVLLARLPPERTGEANELLVNSGVTVHEIAPRRMNLEEYFLSKQ
ncbi:MAG: ABC transporter ATP-binding protein [Planctomycetes bacterium]|nr:ABC transporter ATP-binding protein [Planctomycetota bacterium]